jgi:hypothetical protein
MIKQFNVDYNDPKDLKKHITILQKRRKDVLREMGYDETIFAGSKYSVHQILPLMEKILNCDISHIYLDYNKEEKYYVYVHCDPRKKLNIKNNLKHLFLAIHFNLTHEPIYVGKGESDRYLDLNRNDGHRKIRTQLLNKKLDLIPIKIKDNLNEAKAFELESKLIDILGLLPLSKEGMLINLDEGKEAKKRRMCYPTDSHKIFLKNGFNL